MASSVALCLGNGFAMRVCPKFGRLFWGVLDGFLMGFSHGLLLGDSGQRSCE